MEKIIVEIICPAVSKSYDFRISKRLSVSEGIAKIAEEIREAEHNKGMFQNKETISMFHANSKTVLNSDMSFSENGVKSGDVLMII